MKNMMKRKFCCGMTQLEIKKMICARHKKDGITNYSKIKPLNFEIYENGIGTHDQNRLSTKIYIEYDGKKYICDETPTDQHSGKYIYTVKECE